MPHAKTGEGEPPWDVPGVYLSKLLKAGGEPEDFKALTWARPGTAQRNLAESLIAYRLFGRAGIAALVRVLERRNSGPVWERKLLFAVASLCLPPTMRPKISRRAWQCFYTLALRDRPDLAIRCHRGTAGPRWTLALQRSGWRDSKPDSQPVPELLLENPAAVGSKPEGLLL